MSKQPAREDKCSCRDGIEMSIAISQELRAKLYRILSRLEFNEVSFLAISIQQIPGGCG